MRAMILLILFMGILVGFLESRNIFDSKQSKMNSQSTRILLPQLTPHKDTCYMIAFTTDNNDYCNQMEPVIDRLEKDLNIKVRRFNINRRSDFVSIFDTVGGNEGQMLPFFYNRRSAQAISGPTAYQNLKKLAMGHPSTVFFYPPENMNGPMEDPMKRKDIGIKEFFKDKMFRSSEASDPKYKEDEKNKKTVAKK